MSVENKYFREMGDYFAMTNSRGMRGRNRESPTWHFLQNCENGQLLNKKPQQVYSTQYLIFN